MNNEAIEYYKCDECSFLVSPLEYNAIKFDPVCRCGWYKWSEFRPIMKKPENDSKDEVQNSEGVR